MGTSVVIASHRGFALACCPNAPEYRNASSLTNRWKLSAEQEGNWEDDCRVPHIDAGRRKLPKFEQFSAGGLPLLPQFSKTKNYANLRMFLKALLCKMKGCLWAQVLTEVLRQDGLWERLSSAIPPIQPASLNHPSMSSDADLWYLWHCLWAIRRPKPSQNLTYALQQMTMQKAFASRSR
jgi:hypothetical protein